MATVYFWDDDDRSLAPFRFRNIGEDDTYVPIVPIIQRFWQQQKEELYSFVSYSSKPVIKQTNAHERNTMDVSYPGYDDYYSDYDDNQSTEYASSDEIDTNANLESEESADDSESNKVLDNMIYKNFSYV